MSDEVIDHVQGVDDETVDAFVREAEDGYDVDSLPSEANPHADRSAVVPADLIEAIDKRAAEIGSTPAEVVRRALTAYLDSA